jgi:Zn-dependent M28 family amino/carboxypeptidase
MPILLYDFTDVIAFGAEHSTMGPIVQRAAAGMNVALTPDPLPQEGLFTRSDHYRFVQQGIPSVFLMTGFAGEGEKQFKNFLATNYHSPRDDLNQPLNWDAGAKFARLNYLIAREIADAPQAPAWYSDSFFGRTFGKGQKMAARPAQCGGEGRVPHRMNGSGPTLLCCTIATPYRLGDLKRGRYEP